MAKQNDNHIFVNMMTESLQKKKDVLEEICACTDKQSNLLTGEMNEDEFTKMIMRKGELIENLELLDNGFETLYKKLKNALMTDRSEYVAEISRMKALIIDITGLTSQIQTLEKKNEPLFENYITAERMRLRKLSISQQTAMNYVHNMAGSHKPGNSYFVNETK